MEHGKKEKSNIDALQQIGDLVYRKIRNLQDGKRSTTPRHHYT
jgi:hypothetical protein